MLSVLIPAYNEAPRLGPTIDNLQKGLAAAGLAEFEIIVCDNNSSDGTASAARAAGARVVEEPHNQISRARNRAAAGARGEWLLFVDADTAPGRDLLGAAAAAMARPDVCGGGALVAFDGPIGNVAGFFHRLWNLISRTLGWAAGCFLFCRREAWLAAGGFSEMVYASEEIWFSRKVGRWGKTRGQRFVILTETPVVTSARKFRMFSTAAMARMVFVMFLPGALFFRRLLPLWYRRPGEGEGQKP